MEKTIRIFILIAAILCIAGVLPGNNETPNATDDEKVVYLKTYAPQVWLYNQETFMPSSVDWAFPHLERFKISDGNYWLKTKKTLSSPSDASLPLFTGNLESAAVYSFWVQYEGKDYVDLVYFFYYPYNRGKHIEILGNTVVGNHVSDWEHITVRLMMENGKFTPSQIYLAQHSGGETLNWGDIGKTGDGHPIVYSANGSHASYPDAGHHVYKKISIIIELADDTDQGTAWQTWNRLETYDYEAKKGIGSSTWPAWMSDNFSDPGTGDPSIPGSGPIYRWGNPKDGCDIPFTDECILNDGPTGPVSKTSVWDPNILN